MRPRQRVRVTQCASPNTSYPELDGRNDLSRSIGSVQPSSVNSVPASRPISSADFAAEPQPPIATATRPSTPVDPWETVWCVRDHTGLVVSGPDRAVGEKIPQPFFESISLGRAPAAAEPVHDIGRACGSTRRNGRSRRSSTSSDRPGIEPAEPSRRRGESPHPSCGSDSAAADRRRVRRAGSFGACVSSGRSTPTSSAAHAPVHNSTLPASTVSFPTVSCTPSRVGVAAVTAASHDHSAGGAHQAILSLDHAPWVHVAGRCGFEDDRSLRSTLRCRSARLPPSR